MDPHFFSLVGMTCRVSKSRTQQQQENRCYLYVYSLRSFFSSSFFSPISNSKNKRRIAHWPQENLVFSVKLKCLTRCVLGCQRFWFSVMSFNAIFFLNNLVKLVSCSFISCFLFAFEYSNKNIYSRNKIWLTIKNERKYGSSMARTHCDWMEDCEMCVEPWPHVAEPVRDEEEQKKRMKLWQRQREHNRNSIVWTLSKMKNKKKRFIYFENGPDYRNNKSTYPQFNFGSSQNNRITNDCPAQNPIGILFGAKVKV